MFSVKDAVLSYFVCCKLGFRLYPLAKLAADIRIFERTCDEIRKKCEGAGRAVRLTEKRMWWSSQLASGR